jgi:hypothetical protein
VVLDPSIEHVTINDVDGNIVIQSGPITQIEIQSTVIVNKLKQEEAQKVADRSKIESSVSGNTLMIEAKGDEYNGIFGIKQKSRINLVVTLPSDRKIDLDAITRNGALEANAIQINHELRLETSNGSIHAADIDGNIHLSTSNGAIEASHIGGEAEAKTNNGKITLTEVAASVVAHTTNGAVQVGGGWDLESSNGMIGLYVPASGDYQIKGDTSNGSAKTDLPLQTNKHKIQGIVGSGKYLIEFHTSNSSIEVNKINP